MAKRETKAVLEAKLVAAMAEGQAAERRHQAAQVETQAAYRLNANLTMKIGELTETIRARDNLLAECNEVIRIRNTWIENLRSDVTNIAEEAKRLRGSADYWKGQYQNADAHAAAAEAVAFLFAIPVAGGARATKVVINVRQNAEAVGIEMTDEIKSAVRVALSKATEAVIASEMARAKEQTAAEDPLGQIARLLNSDRD